MSSVVLPCRSESQVADKHQTNPHNENCTPDFAAQICGRKAPNLHHPPPPAIEDDVGEVPGALRPSLSSSALRNFGRIATSDPGEGGSGC